MPPLWELRDSTQLATIMVQSFRGPGGMRKCKIAQKVNRSFTTFVEGHDSVVVSSNFALKKKKGMGYGKRMLDSGNCACEMDF